MLILLLYCQMILYLITSILQEGAVLKIWIGEIQDQIKYLIQNESVLSERVHEIFLRNAIEANDISYIRSLHVLLSHRRYLPFEENALIVFNEELFKHLITHGAFSAYINFLQVYVLYNLIFRRTFKVIIGCLVIIIIIITVYCYSKII